MIIILTNDNEHDNTIEMRDELEQDNINSNGKIMIMIVLMKMI